MAPRPADRPARVAPLARGALGQQPAQHLVGGPAHGRHGGDAQPLVDLGAPRVVDPGDDVLDAERLPGHPRGDDVGVVAAAHRGEGLGLLDAGLEQGVLVEADAGDRARRRSAEPSRRNAVGSWSTTATEWPVSRVWASAEPTRPQPMITMCTTVLPVPRTATNPLGVHGSATPRGTLSRGRPSQAGAGIPSCPTDDAKRILVGRALRSDRLGETLLPKRIALPVFATDALSSVAYATQEILLVLSLGGFACLPLQPVGRRWRSSSCVHVSSPPTGRTSMPTRAAAATTRSSRPTSARGRASSSPARCSSTTC